MPSLKPIFIVILSLICVTAQARLFLNISIINKKGIDKGLTLGSELHSIEEVNRKESIILKMKSGIQVSLNAEFTEDLEKGERGDAPLYGPSSKIKITGKILNGQKMIIKDFSKEPLLIPLDHSSRVTHSKDSQLVELLITPHLK